MIVQIRFDDAERERRPVAATRRRWGAGARVTLEVEREAIEAGFIHVLYRTGANGPVIAGSVSRERVAAALESLGEAAAAWRIARIPLDG
jgi:hypothetical protein